MIFWEWVALSILGPSWPKILGAILVGLGLLGWVMLKRARMI